MFVQFTGRIVFVVLEQSSDGQAYKKPSSRSLQWFILIFYD